MTPLARLQAHFPESAGWRCYTYQATWEPRPWYAEASGNHVNVSQWGDTEDAAVDAVIAAYNALVESSARVKHLATHEAALVALRFEDGDKIDTLTAQLAAARAEIGLLQGKVVEVADQLAAEREHRARKNDATVKP